MKRMLVMAMLALGCSKAEAEKPKQVNYAEVLMPLIGGGAIDEVRAAERDLGGGYSSGMLSFNIESHPYWDRISISVDKKTGDVIPGRVSFLIMRGHKVTAANSDELVEKLVRAEPALVPVRKKVTDAVEGQVRYDFGEFASLVPAQDLMPGLFNVCPFSSGRECVAIAKAALEIR